MLRTIQQTIETRGLLESGQHALVAVSGGADSVALAYALHYLRSQYELLDLTMVHLNHMIRGEEADEDARFVKKLGWRLRVPVICEKADVPQLAGQKGLSLEMAAREARYDFYANVARSLHADCVAVAHTADDQVETLILRLARGAGLQGLGGIPYESRVHGVKVVRPMRDVYHYDAVDFLECHGLDWREDISNQDLQFLRNRVRHEVLPLLERRLNPQIRQVLLRTSELLRDENAWLNEIVTGVLEKCVDESDPMVILGKRFRKHPHAAQRRAIHRWLLERGVDPAGLDLEAVNRVLGLLDRKGGTRSVPLSGGWSVICRYHDLHLQRGRSQAPEPYCQLINVPGETILVDEGLRVLTEWKRGIIRQRSTRVGMLPADASFDASAVQDERLYVRSWEAGDRISPLGFQGTKKIQDLFVDQKVPRDQRHHIPLLECRGEIIWIPGYQVARGWEVKGARRHSLHVHIERIAK